MENISSLKILGVRFLKRITHIQNCNDHVSREISSRTRVMTSEIVKIWRELFAIFVHEMRSQVVKEDAAKND